jgi:hypothetical protein
VYEERNGDDILIHHFTLQASSTCVMKYTYILDTLYIFRASFLKWYCFVYVGKCFSFQNKVSSGGKDMSFVICLDCVELNW